MPEDARFCHRCGKPQLEDDIARLNTPDPIVPVTVDRAAPVLPLSVVGVSFRDTRAVLISILVAAGTLVGITAVGLVAPVLVPLILCAAGFLAVRFYRGQSAEPISTVAGAQLGWMTGLWLFVVVAMICAMLAIYVANPQGWEQLKQNVTQLHQYANLPSSQHDFLMQLLLNVPLSFFFLTLLPGLGGVLGAKLSARRRPS